MTLVTQLIGDLKFTYAYDVGGENALYTPEFSLNDSLASGVGLDAADKPWVSKATALSGSATNSHDLAGVLTDASGATLTFVKVKGIYIHNLSTTAGNTITVGANAAAVLIFGTATHTHTIGPNGRLLIWEPSLAGIAVTATTADILDVANDTANAVTYDIAVWGTSS